MEGQRAVGLKNVSINEWFFAGHYPDYPIMPGVLILEALAQTAAVMLSTQLRPQERLPVLAGVDQARFRRAVRPGDTLRLEVETRRIRSGLGVVAAKASVDGELVCEAQFLFASAPLAAAKPEGPPS